MGYTGQAKRAYQLAWMMRRRDEWMKENGPCACCGSDDRLEIDHIDPTTKVMNPSTLWSRKADVREVELAKCQVLCYSCHMEKTLTWRMKEVPPHGTRARYMRIEYKCRCVECRRANAEYSRSLRAQGKLLVG